SNVAKVGLGGRLALMVAGVLFALVACEVLLRIANISYPLLLTADPVTGLGHIPGAGGRYLQEGGGADIRINGQGLRDREHSFEKPAGTLRVAVLGDSYTEAFQVDARDTYWAVMERRLSERLAPERVEVIDFGVSGFGTGSELLAFRHRALRYHPDAV